MAVGNLPKLLPVLVAELQQQPRRQYLLLSSMREVLYCDRDGAALLGGSAALTGVAGVAARCTWWRGGR